ncbi:AraC family transcriptional regulator [Vibrio chagasii]|uniref:helix-turn-helix domain-containing protein n=1 Tax=Vibrio chagasii TaxID=170679 RepID=UPI001EFEED4D|nr:AraC family transcriptional regulator [Vibrio chagasii]MCG9564132.1 AraC family transcriptional regulator [Vibrio chagasii]CAH6962650.1 AraC family transcriptional regulator [Vibrio chagasii]CAH7305957.1 AraC family transcriptional regulator [Vibrio chagasii]CAH7363316.1 AraC family transcriptional regulator [Vibrio chagasii]CAH7406731.1 AraC family transcriptional regulator [Vibrio chagasii]
MLAIPLPFVAALLLLMTGVLLRCRYPQTSQKPFWFIILCALMVTVVGLRWTVDIALFRFLQPILGASVPAAAWLCFAGAHRSKPNTNLHWLGPIAVLVGSLFYTHLWAGTLDVLLILLYLGYGGLLLKSSSTLPEQVRLTDISKVLVAERVAGVMLLFSALVDSVLFYDILLLNAQHTNLILSISYLVLIPAIVSAVMVVSMSTPAEEKTMQVPALPAMSQGSPEEVDTSTILASSLDDDQTEETTQIMAKFDALMRERQVFKDPDLSLNRLARKLGIPARKISSAVNQTHQQNISKVINAYRIEHAKTLLKQTDEAITEIYLSSGFQTKSNFNREFSRITGQTPSEFRSSPQMLG